MSLCLFAVWLGCVLLDTNLSPLTWMLVRGGWEHLCWPQILAAGQQTAAVAALPAGAVEVGQPQRLGLAVWRRWGGGILVDHSLGVQTHILRAQAGRWMACCHGNSSNTTDASFSIWNTIWNRILRMCVQYDVLSWLVIDLCLFKINNCLQGGLIMNVRHVAPNVSDHLQLL